MFLYQALHFTDKSKIGKIMSMNEPTYMHSNSINDVYKPT
jgi:hypothetical protein